MRYTERGQNVTILSGYLMTLAHITVKLDDLRKIHVLVGRETGWCTSPITEGRAAKEKKDSPKEHDLLHSCLVPACVVLLLLSNLHQSFPMHKYAKRSKSMEAKVAAACRRAGIVWTHLDLPRFDETSPSSITPELTAVFKSDDPNPHIALAAIELPESPTAFTNAGFSVTNDNQGGSLLAF